MTSAHAPFQALLSGTEHQRLAPVRARLDAARAAGRTGLVLFGGGFLGKHTARVLASLGTPALAFVDNNPAKAGMVLEGLPVFTPGEAAERYGARAVFVVTIFTHGPVSRQLEGMGLTVLTFPELAWCFPEAFLPFASLDRPSTLLGAAPRIQEARGLWADVASLREYDAQVAWRTTLDPAALIPSLPHEEIYFPEDLFRVGPEEVVVDCGAFDGDTLRALLERVPLGVRHYFGVEPDPSNAAELRACMDAQAGAAACTVLPCALGRESGSLRFVFTGTWGSRLGEQGTTEVPVRRLDDLLAGATPTFIKMDIEGAERAALEGAEQVIRTHRPVLAICLYHRPEDLWDLPLLIRSYAPEYRLYLRRYCDDCWEQVCYAVPPARALGTEGVQP